MPRNIVTATRGGKLVTIGVKGGKGAVKLIVTVRGIAR